MEREKVNQYIVVGIILALLFIVVSFIVYSIYNQRVNTENEIKVKLNQIYSADYRLTVLDDNYFIGSYSKSLVNDKINVIIDSKGTEIVKNIDEITYDNIFKMKNGNYLIYNNIDNRLNCYIFDGSSINYFKSYENVIYAKPLIYINGDEEYIIGFASIEDNNLNLFDLESNEKAVLENKSIMADYNVEGVYYTFNEKYLVVKDNDGFMGVVDKTGKQVIDYQYKNIVNTNNNSFIAISKKNKYGIIDSENKTIVNFNYDVIARFNEYYLFVKGNKMALYDREYSNLTDFKMNYDSLIGYDFRSKVNSIDLYKIDDNIVVLNNNRELNNGTEYDKHNLYVISDNRIKKNITQTGFDCRDVIYTIDKNHTISIYNKDFESVLEFKIEDLNKIEGIKVVDSDIYQIKYLNSEEQSKTYYINEKGEEVEFNYGDILAFREQYRLVEEVKENKHNVILYNKEYEKVSELTGENIMFFNDYVIVDNSIYKVIIS